MDVNKPLIGPEARKIADQLKGNLSYGQHYAYLLDWYMNDRNGWKAKAPAAAADGNGRNGEAIADEHVKRSLGDVLESLKHLDKKISRVSAGQAGSAKIKVDAKRQGNIFTRLVDGRRFEKIEG
jgi:hypothetical protein